MWLIAYFWWWVCENILSVTQLCYFIHQNVENQNILILTAWDECHGYPAGYFEDSDCPSIPFWWYFKVECFRQWKYFGIFNKFFSLKWRNVMKEQISTDKTCFYFKHLYIKNKKKENVYNVRSTVSVKQVWMKVRDH